MSGQTDDPRRPAANNVGEALVDSVTMVAMTIGPEVGRNFNGRPGTDTAKAIAVMRAEFLKAQDYARRREQAKDGSGPSRDLKMEILARVLRGEVPARITRSANDIPAALRLQRSSASSSSWMAPPRPTR